jgi:fatty acid desaturase
MANGATCGQATLGTYCWFHETLMTQQAQPQAGQTHTAGTSNTWATTNTTPELAVAQNAVNRQRKAAWYSGMKWWKVLIAVAVIGLIIWKFWPILLLIGAVLLLIGFLRMLGGMNYNRNDNANENVNQNTVSPTFNVSPIVNVQVFGEDQ